MGAPARTLAPAKPKCSHPNPSLPAQLCPSLCSTQPAPQEHCTPQWVSAHVSAQPPLRTKQLRPAGRQRRGEINQGCFLQLPQPHARSPHVLGSSVPSRQSSSSLHIRDSRMHFPSSHLTMPAGQGAAAHTARVRRAREMLWVPDSWGDPTKCLQVPTIPRGAGIQDSQKKLHTYHPGQVSAHQGASRVPTYHRRLRPRNRRSRRPRCTSTRPRCTPCSCTATARAGRAAGDSPPRPSRPRSPGASRTAPSAGCSGGCRGTAASSPHTLRGWSHAHTSPCTPRKPLSAPLSPLGPTYRSPARRSHPGSRRLRRTASCWKRSGRRHTATRGGPRHREHLWGQHTVSGDSTRSVGSPTALGTTTMVPSALASEEEAPGRIPMP